MLGRHKWFGLKRLPASLALLSLLLAPLGGCGGSGDNAADEHDAPMEQEEPLTLGPVDGFDLAPTDIERVAVGMVAPEFSLESLTGEVVTLSSFRGAKNVVLVFYRGHW